MFASAKPARKNRIGSIGAVARSSQGTNAASSGRADDERADDLRAAPSPGRCRGRAPDDSEQAGAREREARQVELAVRAVALLEPAQRERHEHDSDRDVEPEDPLPRDALDDRAADERPEGDREPADAAPCAEREPAAAPAATAALRSVRVSGITIAPPRPCTARATLSASIARGEAAAAEPSVKIASPTANIRRRPKRSPSAAPVRSSTANVRV